MVKKWFQIDQNIVDDIWQHFNGYFLVNIWSLFGRKTGDDKSVVKKRHIFGSYLVKIWSKIDQAIFWLHFGFIMGVN